MNRENFEQIELRIERCLPCAVSSCLELNKQMGSKLVKGEILWRRTENAANKGLRAFDFNFREINKISQGGKPIIYTDGSILIQYTTVNQAFG